MTKTLTAPPLRCEKCGWPWHVPDTSPLEVRTKCDNCGGKMKAGPPLPVGYGTDKEMPSRAV